MSGYLDFAIRCLIIAFAAVGFLVMLGCALYGLEQLLKIFDNRKTKRIFDE